MGAFITHLHNIYYVYTYFTLATGLHALQISVLVYRALKNILVSH